LVKQTVNEFLRTDLPGLVKTELREHFKALIVDELKKPEWAGRWDGQRGDELASELVTRIVKENSADILASMMAGFITQNMRNIREQINRGY
jgi:hypothetical protein